MALRNRPFALGVASRVPTLIPPADSPKIVTLFASPPKLAMLALTHSKCRHLIGDAADPRVTIVGAEQLLQVQEAERVEPVIDRYGHDSIAGEVVSRVPGHPSRTGRERAAVYPHHHGERPIESRSENVQCEAVLGLRIGLDRAAVPAELFHRPRRSEDISARIPMRYGLRPMTDEASAVASEDHRPAAQRTVCP